MPVPYARYGFERASECVTESVAPGLLPAAVPYAEADTLGSPAVIRSICASVSRIPPAPAGALAIRTRPSAPVTRSDVVRLFTFLSPFSCPGLLKTERRLAVPGIGARVLRDRWITQGAKGHPRPIA